MELKENLFEKAAVVIPSLDPDEKLEHTVKGLIAAGFKHIILVNDGSKPEKLAIFKGLEELTQVTLLGYEINRGKGYALKTAFSYVMENRPDIEGVITADGDGQHLPEDILACGIKMLELQDSIVLGARDFYRTEGIMIEDGVETIVPIPPKSRSGNLLTIKIFKLLCGMNINDTQTGLRAIPSKYLKWMCEIEGDRFEYETQMLLEINEKKVPYTEVSIKTVYIGHNEATHFHPIKDSWRIYSRIFGRFLRFIMSSGASFAVDYSLYSILLLLIGDSMERKYRIFSAVAGARVVSSLFNYSLNRKTVFKSKENVGRSLGRYYTLSAAILLLSYGLTYFISNILSLGRKGEMLVKLPVDCLLFISSYKLQKKWVFKKD